MHSWSNTDTGHNRTIDTGPTPDGRVANLLVTLGYRAGEGAAAIDCAVNLDGHIIPLILRLPEMRAALAECQTALTELGEVYGYGDNMRALLARIEALTAPTREESEHGA